MSKWLYLWMAVILLAALSMCPAASVKIAWDPPASTNGVAGYMIHWGPSSGNYTNHVDVGPILEAIVHGVDVSACTNFFVLTAYNAESNHSEYSDEFWINPVPGKPRKGKVWLLDLRITGTITEAAE